MLCKNTTVTFARGASFHSSLCALSARWSFDCSLRAPCALVSAAGGDIVEWRDPNDHSKVAPYVVAFASLQQTDPDGKFINIQSSYRDNKDKTGYEVLVVQVSSYFSCVLVLSCCRFPGLPLTYVRKLPRPAAPMRPQPPRGLGHEPRVCGHYPAHARQ